MKVYDDYLKEEVDVQEYVTPEIGKGQDEPKEVEE